MPRPRSVPASLVLALLLGGACSERVADEPIDYEALKVDACERVCGTMDACDPDRFEGQEPDDCFERCMTLMPMLHEENQCGSREMLWMRCVGELSCEEFAIYDAAEHNPPDYSARCMAEHIYSSSCSTDEPFNLDEPVPPEP